MGAVASTPCCLSTADDLLEAGDRAEAPLRPAPSKAQSDGSTSRLLQAAVAGDAVGVQKLLAAGCSADSTDDAGLRPLHLAALHGHAEVAQTLLAASAAVHATMPPPSCKTPLAVAAVGGRQEVFEVLLQASRSKAAGSSSEASETSGSSSAESSEASEGESQSSSNGSMERYTLHGAMERERGLWALADQRMAYRLWRGRGGVPRHLHSPPAFRLADAPAAENAYVVVPGLLSPTDIAEVHVAGRLPSVRRCEDRAADLVYDHVAYRFENELRAGARGLYRRLLGVMVWADLMLWGALRGRPKVFPEFEYIRYDGKPSTEEYAIHPHVDNRSLVTLVCMLSDRRDFAGGTLGFEPAQESSEEEQEGASEDRLEELEPGTAVIFRGERLEHWVRPVLSGTRYVLQIELASV
uniref:Fe2OG dioxygenase domain-containing protein n=1 Tax=Alexandrium monilatum TaxID=311494 RepID=A0A7S4RNV6_9DINO